MILCSGVMVLAATIYVQVWGRYKTNASPHTLSGPEPTSPQSSFLYSVFTDKMLHLHFIGIIGDLFYFISSNLPSLRRHGF